MTTPPDSGANDPVVNRLLETLPERMRGAGARTLRRIVSQVIPWLRLTQTEAGSIQGFDDQAWQRLWSALLQAGPSYGARRRYKKLLLEAAEAWKTAGLVETSPDLDLPPQHHRRLTVHVRRLKGFRFSDYQRLVQAYAGELTGKGASLVPGGLRDEPASWLALGLILGGICVSGVISHLTEWKWGDVPFDPGMPLQRPNRKRQGFIWHALLPLPRLLLLTLFFREKLPPLENCVLSDHRRQLGRQVNHLLGRLCSTTGPAPIHTNQLTEFVRLDLRQVLPDLHLALLCGQIESPTAPADQVMALLHELQPDANANACAQPTSERPKLSGTEAAVPKRAAATTTRKPGAAANVHSEPDDNDALLGEYERLLKSIAHPLRAFWQPSPPKRSLSALERWARAALSTERQPVGVPRFNLSWLVRWLLDMVRDRKLRWRARARYWSAVLQIVYLLPACPLHEMNQASLEDASVQAHSPVTRAALRRLMDFLRRSGMDVADINWRALSRPRAWQPVRALTFADQRQLLNELHGTSLGRAAFLARHALLRESEVCHLQVDDLDTTGQPYLIAWRSKRGRSRRITLDHLSVTQLRQLDAHRRRQTNVGRPHFITDPAGQPLLPKSLSEDMRAALEVAGLRDETLTGRPVRFHDWRAAGADALFRQTGDVRYVALQMGHALVTTTIENYLRTLDLQALLRMQQWKSPLNRAEACMPLATLATLLDREPERVSQMVGEFNAGHAEGRIQLRKADQLEDGPRPSSRTGKPANYIRLDEALRLVTWLIQKSRRGRNNVRQVSADQPR